MATSTRGKKAVASDAAAGLTKAKLTTHSEVMRDRVAAREAEAPIPGPPLLKTVPPRDEPVVDAPADEVTVGNDTESASEPVDAGVERIDEKPNGAGLLALTSASPTEDEPDATVPTPDVSDAPAAVPTGDVPTADEPEVSIPPSGSSDETTTPASQAVVEGAIGEVMLSPAAAGFVGEIAPDGFRLAAVGMEFALTRAGEKTVNRTVRLDQELFREFHQMRLAEGERLGVPPDAQRVLDAALSYIPESLDDIEAFVAAVPAEFRGAKKPVELGNRVRESVASWISGIPTQFKAAGRPPVKVELVYRAAIWHYVTRYRQRSL